jgi:hypothetical protein
MNAWLVVVMVLALMGGGTGCLNLGGGRQVVVLPMGASPMAFDSVGVAMKSGKAAGATLGKGAGSGNAAEADADTKTGGLADQIVQVGGDASNSRSVDAAMADDQSQTTKPRDVHGNVDPDSAPKDSKTKTIQASIAPGGVAGGKAAGASESPDAQQNEDASPEPEPAPEPAAPAAVAPTAPSRAELQTDVANLAKVAQLVGSGGGEGGRRHDPRRRAP